jgi:hypothetical protein
MEKKFLIDCLYDFSITITCHIHDWGTIGNRKMFVEEYCNNQKIFDKDIIKSINKYSKYYTKNNLSWFPTREEIEEWYSFYKYNEEQK